jgi:nitrogenase molybdenum-iron protein beta chain
MMNGVEKPRFGCTLHGALQTVTQIEGVIPIVHSTSGCAIQHFYAARAGGGASPYLSGSEIPASNIYEKQVIFGGASRLREQMKNTTKVFEGKLYLVLAGCESEMVGDDVSSMTAELAEQGVPVIYYESAGFKGNTCDGYEGVIDAMFTQLPQIIKVSASTDERLINILGVIPGQDLCWQGNLLEIQRIFASIDIRVNTFFGYGQRLENWKQAYQAKLTVVVSSWGLKAAQKLQACYDIPYIEVLGAFLGETETTAFIQKIAALLSADTSKIELYLTEERQRFVHALRQIQEYYFTYRFQKKFAIIGDEGIILRYGTFLMNTLGMELKTAVVTDARETDDDLKPSEDLIKLGASNLCFSKDTKEIAKLLLHTKPELLFGSAFELCLNIPQMVVSYPSNAPVILRRCDIGYTGALCVMEDVSNLIIANDR